jgi:hypothetical protein
MSKRLRSQSRERIVVVSAAIGSHWRLSLGAWRAVVLGGAVGVLVMGNPSRLAA